MNTNHVLDGPDEKIFCFTKVDVIKISCEWKITNFSVIALETGSIMKSSAFSPSKNKDIRWFLGLYPQGIKEETKDFFSLFLYLKTLQDTIRFKTNFQFSILNKDRKKCFVFQSVKTFIKGEGYGADRFVLRSKIMNDTHLPNDCLTIVCDMMVGLNNVISESCTLDIVTNEKCELQLLNNYEAFLKNQDLCDMTIIVSGKKLLVHKFILAAQSPVFLAMFKNNTKENQENKIEITDIKFNVFQELIRFMYCGKVENMDSIVNELLIAADKYAINGLMMKCEQYLENSLNPDNVIDILVLADNHNANNLRQSAIKLYAADKKRVMNKFDIFVQLKLNTIKEILKLTMQ